MLATIQKIEDLRPHPNADKLELARVLGFQVVVPVNTYKNEDPIVFVQPDSLLPDSKWAIPYKKYAPKRIKAIRLRGEWSEGLIINLKDVLPFTQNTENSIGFDLSEILNITKYEPPLPNDLSAVGSLPYGIPKTDETRIENLRDIPWGVTCDVTLKIDGSSATFFYHREDDRYGVTSRSLELNQRVSNNWTFISQKYDIENKLRAYCKKHEVSLALRGEIYGAGIQSFANNPHSKIQEKQLAVFSVFNLGTHQYEEKGSQHYFVNMCKEIGLPAVPIWEEDVELTLELVKSYAHALPKDGEVSTVPVFEGIVIKWNGGSFKVINKDYDSKK